MTKTTTINNITTKELIDELITLYGPKMKTGYAWKDSNGKYNHSYAGSLDNLERIDREENLFGSTPVKVEFTYHRDLFGNNHLDYIKVYVKATICDF